MQEWSSVCLDELTENDSPITYGVIKPGPEGSVLFVRGGDLEFGRVRIEQLRTISADVSNQYKRTVLRGGELLISLVGTPGQVAIAPPSLAGANIARQVGLIRLLQDIDKRYVCYFLQSPQGLEALGAETSGSVQLVINLGALRTVKIPIPPKGEQKRIVAILDQVFSDIEQARAKTEQNLKNVRDLYLSKKREIFDRLKLTAELMSLPSVCDEIFAGGDAPNSGHYSKNKTNKYQIPIYANAVKDHGLYGFTDYSRANKPSITIAARGSGTGHIELRREAFLPIVRLIVLIPNEDLVILEYLKHALQNLDILRSGSAIPQLTVPMIKEYSIPVPALDMQKTVIDELEQLDDYIKQVGQIYKQKIILLDELKKSILQKAFTGQLTNKKTKRVAA